MTGWKTKSAAALLMIYGTAGYFLGLHDLTEGVRLFAEGLGLVGIGHKIEKAGEWRV